MQQQAKAAMGKLPLTTKRLSQITKITFETADGRSFTMPEARIWKLNLSGNLAYQIRGNVPDLEEVLPDTEPEQKSEQDDEKGEN
jgi:NACalpha-BTF3-like transcription factor